MRKIAVLLVSTLTLLIAPMAHADVPSNDNLANAAEVSTPYSFTANTADATTELGEPTNSCTDIRPTTHTVWFKFTSATDANYLFSTLGSDYDTITATYYRQSNLLASVPFNDMYLINCNDDGTLGEGFEFFAPAGETLYFQVGGHIDSPSGNLQVSVDTLGKISGMVTDESSAPLKGICIEAQTRFDYPPYPPYGAGYPYGYGSFGFAQTKADGTYTISDLMPGDYYVDFYQCNGDTQHEWNGEFYNDAQFFDDATKVTVSAGTTTADINASLHDNGPLPPPPPPIDADVAITNLTVENVSIRTDQGETVSPGHNRNIHLTVSNLIDSHPNGVRYQVRMCPRNASCSLLDEGWIDLNGKTSFSKTIPWNALNNVTVGDVSIEASTCGMNVHDLDQNNNDRSIDHYAFVGGTGFGYSVLGSYDPGSLWCGDAHVVVVQTYKRAP
ncbi:MAG: carboxypeptidase-like regulatory domain-containing protein [Actinomycetota bacterium]